MGAPGCDDAPMVTVPLAYGVKPYVTLVYPYYENPEFFCQQLAGWARYSAPLCSRLRVIVVDDCSPTSSAEDVVRSFGSGLPFSLRLFRVEVDVRWNWLAARNIGAHVAEQGWLLLTDMDHVVSETVLHRMVHGEHDQGTIYRFSRVEHSGVRVHPHPNSWFMTRKMFWKVGGYDEACSGFYGTDGDYRRRCAATAPILIQTEALVRHEYQGDSSTTRYLRKQPEDAEAKRIMRRRQPGWRPRTLSFPHHEVALPC